MLDQSGGASRTALLSLFWASQGSLLSWCYLQLKGGASTSVDSDLARSILLKCETVILMLLMMSESLTYVPVSICLDFICI